MTNGHIQQLPNNEQVVLKKLVSTQEVESMTKDFFFKVSSFLVGKDVFIFMYFGGKGLDGNLYPMLEKVLTNKKCYHIWNNSKSVTELSKLVFETWREGE